MAKLDITIEICGTSGDGTIAAGGLLNAALANAGLSLMAFDSYPAEIRGFGRCVTRCRAGWKRMLAMSDKTQVLISLDDEQSQSRIPFLADDAAVLFDNRPPALVPEGASLAGHVEPGTNLCGVPLGNLAIQAAGTTRGRNIVALGAFAALFGLEPGYFQEVISKKFTAKGETVLGNNLKSFTAGYEYALDRYGAFGDTIFQQRSEGEEGQVKSERVLRSGNVAVAQGALNAGLKVFFGYPITPATPIMEYLAKSLPEEGGRVVQMEDEISSIGGVLGCFYAGTRSMTATSGPGLALMTELIGLGVVTETPAVIVDAQRGGPSTGLPTKTEQSDLHAAVFGGPGDSARIVIAPTSVEECHRYTCRSFQLAEKYQTPVIVLTDFFLNNRVETIAPVQICDEERRDANIYPDPQSKDNFKRYEVTDSGISPRPLPGTEGFIYTTTGLEHNPEGKPDYSASNHTLMSEKRHRKIYGALKDLPRPEEFTCEGEIALGVIAWGSTFGAALEAVQMAQDAGYQVAALKVTSLFPYHGNRIQEFMNRCGEVLIPELNFEGQLATLISHLHRKRVVKMNVVSGVPLYPVEILRKIKEIL